VIVAVVVAYVAAARLMPFLKLAPDTPAAAPAAAPSAAPTPSPAGPA